MSCPKLKKYHTINFKTKNYEQILLETLQDSIEKQLISQDTNLLNYLDKKQDIENQYILQASIHSQQLEKCYDELQNIYDAQDINKAKGEDLDHIGEQLGFTRPTNTHSYTDLTFTLPSPADETVIIPKNTLISTEENGGINYRTNSTGKIRQGNRKVQVPATSIDYGRKTHVRSDELTHIQKHLKNTIHEELTVTNIYESSGGQDRLTDDEYRQVLLKWNTIHEKGTKDAYIHYLDNVDGLESYNLISCWDGAGTVKIVVEPNSQYLVDIISTELYDNVQLFDDDVLIVGANQQSIDIYCTVDVTLQNTKNYTSDELENLKNEITELIRVYVEGGYLCGEEYIHGLGIGENFIPYKCANFITNRISDVENINFEDRSIINVDEESKAVLGAVNVEII